MIKKIFSLIISLILSLCFCIPKIYAENTALIFSKSNIPTKKLALTFDDGPHPRYTNEILDILEEYNVKATFFVIGVNIENYPGIIENIYAKGHEIGNHTYSHSSKQQISEDELKNEIDRCQELISSKIGIRTGLFRPPRGKLNKAVENFAAYNNYTVILWSIDTMDWAHRSPENIMKNIENTVKGGDIILMHDYISGKNTTIDALRLLIPRLQSLGYEFVTVSELIDSH